MLSLVPVPAFIIAVWNHDAIRFGRSVVRDLAKSAIVLLSLQALWLLIKRMELSGYPSDRLEYFDRVHFCIGLSAVTLIGINFIVKLAIGFYIEKP